MELKFQQKASLKIIECFNCRKLFVRISILFSYENIHLFEENQIHFFSSLVFISGFVANFFTKADENPLEN
jgi:hypothetical protein